MLRELSSYLVLALAIGAAGGAAYGAGLIGVLAVYATILAAVCVGLIGYVRWDERHQAR
jgi:hypothetical protein